MPIDISLIPQERIKDLVSTLDNIQNNISNNIVHKSGNETINGTKTFTSSIQRTASLGGGGTSLIKLTDSNGKGSVNQSSYYVNGVLYNRLNIINSSSGKEGYIEIQHNDDGEYRGVIGGNGTNLSLTRAVSSTTENEIPTKGWVNNPATSTNVVHRSGDEVINGKKTFTGELNKVGSARFNAIVINDTSYDYLTNPSENLYNHIVWRDKNNKDMSYVQQLIDTNGTVSFHHVASNYKTDGTRVTCGIGCCVSRDGSTWTYAQTPPASDNSTKIVTTNWSKVVHPTYPNITTSTRVSVPANTDYSIPYDCWVWWGNTSYVGLRYLYVNGIEFGHSYGSSGHWQEFNTLFFPIKVGNVIRHTGDNSTCFLYQNVY